MGLLSIKSYSSSISNNINILPKYQTDLHITHALLLYSQEYAPDLHKISSKEKKGGNQVSNDGSCVTLTNIDNSKNDSKNKVDTDSSNRQSTVSRYAIHHSIHHWGQGWSITTASSFANNECSAHLACSVPTRIPKGLYIFGNEDAVDSIQCDTCQIINGLTT